MKEKKKKRKEKKENGDRSDLFNVLKCSHNNELMTRTHLIWSSDEET